MVFKEKMTHVEIERIVVPESLLKTDEIFNEII